MVRIVLQLGVQVALARILGPQVYGLFALGVLVIGVSSYFADFGLAYGLIQKQDTNDDDIRFVWTWQCLLGLLVAAAVWLSAGALASVFNKPEVQPVFAWLSLVCLLNALTAPSTNLLKKALDYKALQIAQLGAYLAGYLCVGVPLAILGYGVQALVAAMLVNALANLAMQYAQARHALGIKFTKPGGAKMLRYGAIVLLTNLVNWLLTSLDKLMVGRLFPAQTVGAYTTAFNLVNSPASAAYGNLQSVVFSASARLQGDAAALKAVFLRLLAGVFVTAFPLFAVLGVGSELGIAAVYGARWAEAAPFLRVFAFAMPCLLVWGISTPVLWNTGRQTLEFRLQLPMLGIWCLVLLAVASEPGATVALAAGVLFAMRAAVMAICAARILRVGAVEAGRAIAGGLLLTALMVAGSFALLPLLARLPGNAQLHLCLLLAGAGATYLLALLALGPLLIDRALASTLRGAAARLPPPVARAVRAAAREGSCP